MFVWYWTSSGYSKNVGQFDYVSYPWTDEDVVGYCFVKSSDCCMMVPPDGWDCN